MQLRQSHSQQHTKPSLPPLRRLSLGDQLAIVASLLFLCSFTLDPWLARLVLKMEPATRHLFSVLTRYGKSDWIFVLSGLAVIGLFVVLRHDLSQRLRTSVLHLLDATAFLIAAIAGSGLLVQLIKTLVGRARPKYLETLGPLDFQPFRFGADFASFPSGHSVTVFALATVVAVFRRQWAIPAYLLAFWVAFSRVVTGAHYSSDIVAGAALGTIFTLVLRDALAARGRLFALDANGRPHLRGSVPLRRLVSDARAHVQRACANDRARQPEPAAGE